MTTRGEGRGALPRALLLLDRFNRALGEAVAWLYLPLIGIVIAIVVLRYVAGVTYVWLEESQWYLFALIVCLGFADAWSADAHVRIDLFYDKMGERGRLWVNFLGALLFATPFALLLSFYCGRYFLASYAIAEGSPQFSGLPARWAIKLVLFLGCVVLLLQALVETARSGLRLAARPAA